MSTPHTILIIEDEEDLREITVFNLKSEGYQVLEAESGEAGLALAQAKSPDLILLDIMLPSMSGLDVCRHLKADKTTQDIPIIMVSAKGEEMDIVIGLELGAEDYIPKPYSPRILMARIRTVLRRTRPESTAESNDIIIDDLKINTQKHTVHIQAQPIDLTKSEFAILSYLASNRGWVYTRFQIVNAIRGDNYVVTERAIDVQIAGLRKKIAPYGQLIETVRGVGYRFKE